ELTHLFADTGEGVWLLAHAHEYGFTLSYPQDAYEVTGFYYEPWHYRYVGVELATQLKEQGMALSEHLLNTQPAPCLP
ncbi:MAG: D-alanyl-D-alanine carboxypeptidase family protein, partial [Chloroflexota bacterium]